MKADATTISNKFYRYINIGIILILFYNPLFGQNPSNKIYAINNPENKTIQHFEVINQQGVSHLKWLLKDQQSRCYFIIERSINNLDYEVIHIKNGLPTPGDTPLLYCYTDTVSVISQFYYRLTVIDAFEKDTTSYQTHSISNPRLFESQPVTLRNQQLKNNYIASSGAL